MRREIITTIASAAIFTSCATSSTPQLKINIIDSLRVESGLGEVVKRTYEGVKGKTTYTVNLFYQEYSGDGVFSLDKKGEKADTALYGRRFTLRGDATDINAIVYELIPYTDALETTYFLYKDDYLEQLGSNLESINFRLNFKK